MCRRDRRSAVEKERACSRGVSELRPAAGLCEVTIVPRASPLSSSARAFAVVDRVESVAGLSRGKGNAYRRESRGLRGSSIAPLLPSHRQVLPPVGTLATAATTVNWDQNCCCVPRAVMEVDHYGGVEAIRKLLELLLMSLMLLFQFWAVFTFDTYSIWILYSAVTTITVVDLLPLLP
ncbi:uncharacterized protein DS421_15g514410 [Arachis hypogaea]|nr:uncharacterized protein DS421_15g514410 [Arachis hypogaea]